MKKWQIFVLMSIKIDLHAMKCIYCFSKEERKKFGATKGESVNREGQTIQWPQEKGQKDKQRSTKTLNIKLKIQ